MSSRSLNRAYQLADGERVLLAGCSKAIAERTRDGTEVVEFMLGVMRGRRYRWPELHPKELPSLPLRPTPALRQGAAEWLADRLWGRVPSVTYHVDNGDAAGPIAGLAEALQLTAGESAFLEEARALALRRAEASTAAGELDRSVAPSEAAPPGVDGFPGPAGG